MDLDQKSFQQNQGRLGLPDILHQIPTNFFLFLVYPAADVSRYANTTCMGTELK
jgi:hypothetical protein